MSEVRQICALIQLDEIDGFQRYSLILKVLRFTNAGRIPLAFG